MAQAENPTKTSYPKFGRPQCTGSNLPTHTNSFSSLSFSSSSLLHPYKRETHGHKTAANLGTHTHTKSARKVRKLSRSGRFWRSGLVIEGSHQPELAFACAAFMFMCSIYYVPVGPLLYIIPRLTHSHSLLSEHKFATDRQSPISTPPPRLAPCVVSPSLPPLHMPRPTPRLLPLLLRPFLLLGTVFTISMLLHVRRASAAATAKRSGFLFAAPSPSSAATSSSSRKWTTGSTRLYAVTIPKPSTYKEPLPPSIPPPPSSDPSSSSSVPVYNHRDALMSRDGLPLVYEPKTIKKYWDARPAEMQRRWALFLSVTAPFLTKLGE